MQPFFQGCLNANRGEGPDQKDKMQRKKPNKKKGRLHVPSVENRSEP